MKGMFLMLGLIAIVVTTTIGETRACAEKYGVEYDIGQYGVAMEQVTVFVVNTYEATVFVTGAVSTSTAVDCCGTYDVLPLVSNPLIADADVGWQGLESSTSNDGLKPKQHYTDSDTDLSFRKARDGLTN